MSVEICKKYLDALDDSDLEKVLSFFTESAMVTSTLYGEIAAARFYRKLFTGIEFVLITLRHHRFRQPLYILLLYNRK